MLLISLILSGFPVLVNIRTARSQIDFSEERLVHRKPLWRIDSWQLHSWR